VQVQVLYFGVIRERVAKKTKELITLPAGATVDDLVTELCATYPTFRDAVRHVKVAVNESFGAPELALADGDEVAIIPPVAGGAEPYCMLTEQPLSVDHAISAVTGPEQGAVVVFLGVVRAQKDGKQITELEYEAYKSMATASLRDIVSRCEAMGNDVHVGVAHRFGALSPGQIAVVVAASAMHRDLAFQAARQCIELLKAETPIWKKEFSSDGATWIEASEGISGSNCEWSATVDREAVH
jgi:molybdopterin synthase catalytic subunit